MNYKKLILDSGIILLEGGFTVETWGNISIRDPRTGNIYITPSGMDYKTCTEEDVVVLSLDGQVLEGKRRPSIEKELHLMVYRARPQVGAVVHTHPIYSTVFSTIGEDLPLIIDEAAQTLGDTVRTCPYHLPGSTELASACVQALGEKANACLLKAHGAVCLGKDIKGAFKTARVLEMTAEIYWRARAIGKNPEPISPELIQAMLQFAQTQYGQPETQKDY